MRSELALVQFVTPVTPADRMQMLCDGSGGFIYAVTMTGTTGKNVAVPQEVLDYFDRVQESRRRCRCARASAFASASRSGDWRRTSTA